LDPALGLLVLRLHGYSTTTAALIERVGRIQQDWTLAAFVTEGGVRYLYVIEGQVSATVAPVTSTKVPYILVE